MLGLITEVVDVAAAVGAQSLLYIQSHGFILTTLKTAKNKFCGH
jgi:hypothetical protein